VREKRKRENRPLGGRAICYPGRGAIFSSGTRPFSVEGALEESFKGKTPSFPRVEGKEENPLGVATSTKAPSEKKDIIFTRFASRKGRGMTKRQRNHKKKGTFYDVLSKVVRKLPIFEGGRRSFPPV